MPQRSLFPEGREFAFTILDDTDDTTVENGRPIYDLMRDLGLRTTKTVWALDTPPDQQGPYFAAQTLQDPPYLDWVRELASAGFEIAFHNASMGSSVRERTQEALALIASEFPGMPRMHCNHGENRENVHWGPDRYSSPELSTALGLASRLSGGRPFEGHVEDSPYFWEDVLSETIDYTRRFTFLRLDCGRIPPGRPYLDSRKPNVGCWFNTADAATAEVFKSLVTRKAIDELHAANSWCIVSTHLGKGYCRGGRVDPEVARVLEYIAALPGWYVPVSEILDYLRDSADCAPLTDFGQRAMEYAHVLDRVKARVTGRRSPRVSVTLPQE